MLAVAGGWSRGSWRSATRSPSSRDKVDEFKQVERVAAPGETRLGSTGGQRYDLWRIAWREFELRARCTGVGEGGYPVRYYRERVDRGAT